MEEKYVSNTNIVFVSSNINVKKSMSKVNAMLFMLVSQKIATNVTQKCVIDLQ